MTDPSITTAVPIDLIDLTLEQFAEDVDELETRAEDEEAAGRPNLARALNTDADHRRHLIEQLTVARHA